MSFTFKPLRDDSVMVVCDSSGRPGIPGSWKMCSVCAAEIFLSDSTLRASDSNGFKRDKLLLYCMPCASHEMTGIKEFIPLTEEQNQEISLVRHWKLSKYGLTPKY